MTLMISAACASAESLVIGTTQVPSHFNAAIQSGIATMMPAAQIFASPLMFEEDWTPRPYLAESWETSEDGLTVTLHLRADARFHDGTPVTSSDVAFSIRTIRENHPFTTMLEPVRSVDTPDPLTAVINLARPHPALLLAMSPALMPILPEHIYGSGDIHTHPANLAPVGAGPFRFVEYKQGDYYRLERNPDFFLPGLPMADELIFRIIPDPATLTLALERGEVDINPFVTNIRDLHRLQKARGIVISDLGYEAIGPLNWIAFNTRKPPFDDVRVRRAVGYAIDKRFILDRLMGGMSPDSTGPLAPGTPFTVTEVARYDFDPDKAKALLDAAGYPEGKDGIRFSVTMDYIPSLPEMARNLAEYMRSQLRAVGIDLRTRSSPDFPTWAQRIANYDFDLTQDNVYNWGDPVIGVHRTYLSNNIRKGVIWSNTQQYASARVDDLLAHAAVESDPERRAALYAEFQKIVVQDAPILFVNEVPMFNAARDDIAGVPHSIWGGVSPFLTLHRTE